MAFKEDLESVAADFFGGSYEISKGTAIPSVEDIAFGKVGRELELTMLFADIRESTAIVDAFRRTTAARMYKAFLGGMARIAKHRGGELRSFNGDGLLAVFAGGTKNTSAVRAAMNMKWYCKDVLKPKMANYFENNSEAEDLDLDFGIGVHTGTVLVVRGGFKGENNNDLVWVGNATNYAVKLANLGSQPWNIHITEAVYNMMHDETKYVDAATKTTNMWTWTTLDDEKVLKTTYQWTP